jgi:uncharacterized protein (UPF0335 family)
MADELNSQRLLSGIERYERLEEEKKAIAADQKSIMDEIKEQGFVPKYVKRLIAERKMDPAERELDQREMEVYRHAVGL